MNELSYKLKIMEFMYYYLSMESNLNLKRISEESNIPYHVWRYHIDTIKNKYDIRVRNEKCVKELLDNLNNIEKIDNQKLNNLTEELLRLEKILSDEKKINQENIKLKEKYNEILIKNKNLKLLNEAYSQTISEYRR